MHSVKMHILVDLKEKLLPYNIVGVDKHWQW